MKKVLIAIFVVFVASLGGLVFLFHTSNRDWQNIHPNIVYKMKDQVAKPWYPLVASVLNLPKDGVPGRVATAPPKNAGEGGAYAPDRSFLAGNMEITLKVGGFYYLPGLKKYSPGGTLVFANRSQKETIETLFKVEIIDPKGGTIYYMTRKFVNVKAGVSMEAEFGNREEVVFERPGDAPPLAFRVSLPNGFNRNLTIPRRLLQPRK